MPSQIYTIRLGRILPWSSSDIDEKREAKLLITKCFLLCTIPAAQQSTHGEMHLNRNIHSNLRHSVCSLQVLLRTIPTVVRYCWRWSDMCTWQSNGHLRRWTYNDVCSICLPQPYLEAGTKVICTANRHRNNNIDPDRSE